MRAYVEGAVISVSPSVMPDLTDRNRTLPSPLRTVSVPERCVIVPTPNAAVLTALGSGEGACAHAPAAQASAIAQAARLAADSGLAGCFGLVIFAIRFRGALLFRAFVLFLGLRVVAHGSRAAPG